MISPLAKGDYEDLLAAGLPATLEDFDRLNTIALRLTNGPETTAANFPRIGWAGDVPFHQPTCAAIAWYLECVDRTNLTTDIKNFCWYWALNHARDAAAFAIRSSEVIRGMVEEWMAALPVTGTEISRACLYASKGYDDAEPAKTDAQAAKDAARTEAEVRETSLGNLHERVTRAAALTGIRPADLMGETPSRLDEMIDAVGRLNNHECGRDESRLRADYDLTFREIRKRLMAAKEAASNG